MRFGAAAVLMLLSVPSASRAQEIELPSGVRVRVLAPQLSERAFVGRFDRLAADSLSLTAPKLGTSSMIPLRLITSLELSESRDRWRGAKRGALVGFGSCVVWGLLCAMACEDGALALIGGPLFGLFYGAPVGGILGAVVLAPERWRRVSIPSREVSPDHP